MLERLGTRIVDSEGNYICFICAVGRAYTHSHINEYNIKLEVDEYGDGHDMRSSFCRYCDRSL